MPDTTKLISAIDSYASQAHGSGADDGELSTIRALSLDAYAGKNIEPAPEGRSQVVDWTVFETIQFILPSLCRIFAGGENVVEFEPTGEEDEDAAEQESEYLNYLVTQKNNWFLTFLTWAQDALLTKNSYCLAFMEDKIDVELEKYEGQTEEQVALLMEDDPEVTGHEQYDDPDDEGQIVDPDTGEVIQDEATLLGAMLIYAQQEREPDRQFKQLFDIEIRRTKRQKRLRFKVLPPERCKVGEDTPDFSLDDCNYFEFEDLTTISELRKEGHEIDDDMAESAYTATQEDSARDENLATDLGIETPDKSMKQVMARHIWIRHDYDEDGIAEMQYVLLVGNDVLVREEVSRIPVASMVPFINTHRHMGNSVTDLTFDIQRIKTFLLRGGLDSMALSIRPRNVVSTEVNLDDLMVHGAGTNVRLKKGAIPGQGHVVPLPSKFVFPEAQAGLLHMDTVTESRVGVTKQFQGIDAGANNDHNRIGQLSTMAAQRVEQIARIMANGVERLFSLGHELVIKSGHQSQSIKLRGTWTDLDPSQWKTGRDMRVVAPFAAGNKDSLVQRIMIHMQVHREALSAGLPIVDAENTYNLALELSRATDLAGNKLYTDPNTVEPPPPQPDPLMLTVENETQKTQNEAMDEARKSETDRLRIETDSADKRYQIDVQARTQLLLAGSKEGAAENIEQLRAALKNEPIELGNQAIADTGTKVDELTASITQAIFELRGVVTQIQEDSDAPVTIVRDDKGKIIGKQRGDKFIPISEAS